MTEREQEMKHVASQIQSCIANIRNMSKAQALTWPQLWLHWFFDVFIHHLICFIVSTFSSLHELHFCIPSANVCSCGHHYKSTSFPFSQGCT